MSATTQPRHHKHFWRVLIPSVAVLWTAVAGACYGEETVAQEETARSAGKENLNGSELLLREFARVKEKQMRNYAQAHDIDIPEVFIQYLEAQQRGDDVGARAAKDIFSGKISQYSDAQPDPVLNTPLWMYVHETEGCAEIVEWWDAAMLERYRQDLFAGMPDGSIYFGGTDPGRFVATAFKDTRGEPDIHILTQNALADKLYMDYARERCGEAIRIPTQEEVNKAFQKYVEEVQSGQIDAGAALRCHDGRVTVEGVEGVMKINGLISKEIFEANKENHAFFVEESYVIPWMYPYLEPHGLILKLNSKPLDQLPGGTLERDTAFWKKYLDLIKTDEDISRNASFRMTLAKLRSAIAGVYAHHGMVTESERAYREALELYAFSPEALYRLAYLYVNNGRASEARELLEGALTPAVVQPYGKNACESLASMKDDNSAQQIKQAFAKNAALNPHLVLDKDVQKMRNYLAAIDAAN